MKPRFVVHDLARSDLDEIADYIAQGSLNAALKFLDAARRTFAMIADFPLAGAITPIEGRAEFAKLRTWPIQKFRVYVICYLATEEKVEIIRVIHGARDIARVV